MTNKELEAKISADRREIICDISKSLTPDDKRSVIEFLASQLKGVRIFIEDIVAEKEDPLSTPIKKLGLSNRAVHVLETKQIASVQGILAMSLEELRSVKGCGKETLREIYHELRRRGFIMNAHSSTRKELDLEE